VAILPCHARYHYQPHSLNEQNSLKGIDKLSVVRSQIPAVTHIDYSARLQTVNESSNAKFLKLIKTFMALTGCPLVLNTSFNVKGEPIVSSYTEAFNCFQSTDMDFLVMENILIDKKDITPEKNHTKSLNLHSKSQFFKLILTIPKFIHTSVGVLAKWLSITLSYLILSPIFYGVILPLGLLSRIAKFNKINLKPDKTLKTYWQKSTIEKVRYELQY